MKELSAKLAPPILIETDSNGKAAIAKTGFEPIEHPPYSPDLRPIDQRL